MLNISRWEKIVHKQIIDYIIYYINILFCLFLESISSSIAKCIPDFKGTNCKFFYKWKSSEKFYC